MGIAILLIMFNLIGAICESSAVPEGEMTKLEQLLHPEFPEVNIPVIDNITGVFKVAWNYIQILWDMFLWDYPFFTGSYVFFRWLFIAISVGIVVSLVLATFRGVSSG
jgi:hypothetical protein